MANPQRAISRARDALAEADEFDLGGRLLDLAEAMEWYADSGEDPTHADADRTAALVVRLIADADFVATGKLTKRFMTDTRMQPVLGSILDRMAGTPNLVARAGLVRELWEAMDDEDAAESIACLPYGPLVGGEPERYLPSTLAGLARMGWRVWRSNR